MPVHVKSGSVALSELTAQSTIAMIHGGAGPADPKGPQADAAHSALLTIAKALAHGCSEQTFPSFLHQTRAPQTEAEKTALYGAQLLEEHPLFNAGYGAALQADGVPRVSASFMESVRQKFSAVMNATDLVHPSQLAYYLQAERFCVLDSLGANGLARDLGIARTNLITLKRFERWAQLKRETLESNPSADGKGTIGSLALDNAGTLAAITSTGGVGNETVGRVGDSPTVAGNYCSKRVAVSCTGYGEQILNLGFATRVATRVADGLSLEEAMKKSFAEADERQYEFAAIALALSADGKTAHWCAATTETYFVWAVVLPQKIVTFRDEA